MTTTGENRFVIIAPMFNASATVGQMLASIIAQSYSNWYVILIDDVSDRHEVIKQNEIIDRWSRACDSCGVNDSDGRIRVIWNDKKMWEVANVLHGIRMCDDNSIICRVDADDWLTDTDAFAYLNAVYNQTGADALWTAHRWGFTDKNISGPMPPDANPYKYPWSSSHLKTFRKKLINGVSYVNFTNMNGDLVRRAGDQALFLPILHRATRRGFVPRVMYHYTLDEQGGAVYQTEDAKFQKQEADFIRARGYVSEGLPWEDHDTFKHMGQTLVK